MRGFIAALLLGVMVFLAVGIYSFDLLGSTNLAIPIEAFCAGTGAPRARVTLTVSRIDSTEMFFDSSSMTTFSQGR